jgi:hypothetical protein
MVGLSDVVVVKNVRSTAVKKRSAKSQVSHETSKQQTRSRIPLVLLELC